MSVGLELRPEVVLGPSVVERLAVSNAPGFSGPTLRTLRTNVRFLARSLQAWPSPLPVALPRERCKLPYTPAEISGYLALADAQPTPERRRRAVAVVCLGAGAGLVGTDLRDPRGTDVVGRSGGVLVEVRGARARAVPVLERFAGRLLACAAATGDGFVLGGTHLSRHNVTAALVASLGKSSGLAPMFFFLTCCLAVRNLRVLDAFEARQAEDQRRAAAGLAPRRRRRRRRATAATTSAPAKAPP